MDVWATFFNESLNFHTSTLCCYTVINNNKYFILIVGVTDSRPSTSREALKTISNASPEKTMRQKKTFVKFKDNKYKNQTKKSNSQTKRKQFHYGRSTSQIVSRKILQTIKKKRNLPSPQKQSRTKNRYTNRDSICDLTVIEVAKDISEAKITSDDDDDCVLIDAAPEVIFIDDESTTTCYASNIENGLNISNISTAANNSDLLFKPYQPIGTMSSQKYKNNFLHSTPKLILNESTKYPIAPRYKRTMPMILESTPDTRDLYNSNEQSSEAVVIDDTICRRTRSQSRKNQNEDDSVIFVSEVVNKEPVILPDFIPLNTPTEKYSITIPEKEPKPKRQRNELFSSKEQKQLRQYNENAYNPNKDAPTTMTKKRMVIVDGSNVAYHHALNKEFSVKGLQICLEYFEKLGHEVKAVVPQFRLQKLKSTNPTALEKLHEDGKIVFTPCKNLPGKSSSSYDDRFILQLAAELDAAIVSNDNYRDLIHENPAFKKIIENRVVGFSWCNDLFILPKDPYGKWGPALSQILNRS